MRPRLLVDEHFALLEFFWESVSKNSVNGDISEGLFCGATGDVPFCNSKSSALVSLPTGYASGMVDLVSGCPPSSSCLFLPDFFSRKPSSPCRFFSDLSSVCKDLSNRGSMSYVQPRFAIQVP